MSNKRHEDLPAPDDVERDARPSSKPLPERGSDEHADEPDEDEDEDELDDEDEPDEAGALDDEGEDAPGEDEDELDDEDDPEGPPRRGTPPPWGNLVVPTLLFVAAVALVNAITNARYPLDEPPFWYFILSADTAVILLNFAIMGVLATRVPRWMQIAVVVWLFAVRLLRFGDGIKGRYFAQRFNVYGDLRLVPDGVRFLYSTWPLWQLLLGAVLGAGLLAGLAYVTYQAVGVMHRYLQDRRQAMIAAALGGIVYLTVASADHNARYESYFSGGFAASATSRLEEEAVFLWNVKSQEGEYAKLINETEQMLDTLPSDLSKLHGANVYLILVESYGRALFEWPPLMNQSKSTFDAFETDLKQHGFTLATGILNSSTYGGQSWLAHNTLDTGIPTRTQLEYEIVYAKRPHALASYFNRAGYRSVLVQPNTTRVAAGDFYDFQQKYYNVNFGYRGPSYAWATMPDQFVLDFVRRREMTKPEKPIFVQYVLVSSHAPWSKLPTLVEDWDSVGNGEIFQHVPMLKFPIEWPHFENATEAYGKSIVYDFDLLRRYITRYIDDGSLVIILGDHQPVAEVNGDTWEFGVPVHVLSKNPELVRPFITRGFQPGARPNLAGYAQGLETFMPNFLVDFSTERVLAVPPP